MLDRARRRIARLPYGLWLAVLASALLLSGSGASIRASQALPGPGRIGDTYLALGDSLAAGSLTSLPSTRGYVPLYRDLLAKEAKHPIALANLGVPGETVSSLIYAGQLAAAEKLLRESRVRGRTVSPITVDIGGNDLRALRSAGDAGREVGLANFQRDIAILFDRLLTATTANGQRGSDIITMTIYNPIGGDPAVRGSDAWWVARFNAALTDAAAARAIPVAPAADAFRGHEDRLTWMPADFHPNNAGHVVLAERLWAVSGYDRQPPSLEVIDSDVFQTPHRFVTVKVRATDNVGVTSVVALVDGQPLPAPLFQAALNAYVTYWDGSTATPGPHTLAISASDAAGNSASRQATLTR